MNPDRKPGAGRGATTDWDEVRRRLEAAREAVERGLHLSPEEEARVLRERAKALALEPRTEGGGQREIEVVEFVLGRERFAFESRSVAEIWPIRDLTPVPCTPPFVLGLVNVRGRVLSVIDIGRFFDMPEQGLGDLNKAVVIHDGRMEVGVLADRVVGARAVSPEDLQPSLPTLTGVRAAYLRGVTGDGLVVLDAGRILSDERIIVNEEVRA